MSIIILCIGIAAAAAVWFGWLCGWLWKEEDRSHLKMIRWVLLIILGTLFLTFCALRMGW